MFYEEVARQSEFLCVVVFFCCLVGLRKRVKVFAFLTFCGFTLFIYYYTKSYVLLWLCLSSLLFLHSHNVTWFLECFWTKTIKSPLAVWAVLYLRKHLFDWKPRQSWIPETELPAPQVWPQQLQHQAHVWPAGVKVSLTCLWAISKLYCMMQCNAAVSQHRLMKTIHSFNHTCYVTDTTVYCIWYWHSDWLMPFSGS